MKNLECRIADVSQHLQRLKDPAVFPDVQKAVEKKDKAVLGELCRRIKIPEIYVGVIVSVLLSVGTEQVKYPAPEF